MKNKLNFILLLMMIFLIGCKAKENILNVRETIDGITYYLSLDKKSYAVIEYKGTDKEINILEKCNNIPVTQIGFHVFESNENIEIVNMPNTIEVIGLYAFLGCKNLKTVNLSNNLIKINIGAFQGCDKLQTINIPSSVKLILDKAFYGCTTLNNVTIPNYDIIIEHEVFANCSNLNNITIPDNIKKVRHTTFIDTPWYDNLPEGPIYFGNYLYKYIGLIESDKTFSFKEGIEVIGEHAFEEQVNLAELIIPNSVNKIQPYAFSKCVNLEKIYIPKSVNIIEHEVFYNCNKLTVYCEVDSQPDLWSKFWNSSNLPIIWGYKNE